MSLKELAAAALAAVDVADDIIFDAEMKTTQALGKLRDLQEYLEAAPKTAAELVDGCGEVHLCTVRFVEFGGPRYIFSRAELEAFAQTAFAAGLAQRAVGKSPALGAGYAATGQTAYAVKDEPYPCEPVHDYNGLYAKAYARKEGANQPSGPVPPPATPIRTSESAVDLQFSDGTCVNVRVTGK